MGQAIALPREVRGASPYVVHSDFATITVPAEYNHERRLEEYRIDSFHRNDGIRCPDFGEPSRILKPGDNLRVRLFRQTTQGVLTLEERREFFDAQGAVHVGAQGASLIAEVLGERLTNNYWHVPVDTGEESSSEHVQGLRPCVYRFFEGVLECFFDNPTEAWLEGVGYLLCVTTTA